MSDIHARVDPPGEQALERLRERMYDYIFPNVPRTLAELAAFEQAVQLQYEHEETEREKYGDVPPWAESFKIGDFQMTLREGALRREAVCPAARGLLLRSGLLYRGAEGRR